MVTRCRVVISMHASVPTFGLCCISSAIICAFRSPRDSDDFGPEGVDRPWVVRRDQTVAANQLGAESLLSKEHLILRWLLLLSCIEDEPFQPWSRMGLVISTVAI